MESAKTRRQQIPDETGRLEVDAAGELIGAVFGNDCLAAFCVVDPSGTNDWFFAIQPLDNLGSVFIYAVQGVFGFFLLATEFT